ncbi:FG-GAP-like repeat-containing protein [Streptomyces virginiae]|uniref:FG-GAP-like repeat-containing protein n=1 Tax=Streptomyces virginiae TaxID=1961 RepID=UPI00363C9D7B
MIYPSTSAAAAVDPVAEGSMTAADFALAKAKETGQPYELTSARTENSDTWALPTGKWSVKRHGTTVRVRRAGGWVATDPTLQFAADGKVKPKASAVAIAFSGGGTGPLLTGVKNGRTLSFTWPQALPKPTLAANVATYANVLPDVDLQLKAEVEGFSQLLVVKTAAAARHPDLATLRFKLDTVGLDVTKNTTTGLLTATNPAGEVVFTSPNPVMWDSTTTTGAAAQAPARAAAAAAADAGTSAAPADVFVTPSGAKNAQMPTTISGGNLEIKPDQALLTGAGTKYPVYIDPSVTWGERQNWSWVYRTWENHSYWNTKEDVRVGYESETNGLSRSFFQLDTSAVKGAQVSKATFRIKETWSWSCTPKPVELWTTNPISRDTTWKYQPDRRNKLDTVNAAKGRAECAAGNLEFNATGAVQEAASKGWSSMTVGLYASNESDEYHWKRFDPKTVTLEIEYNNPPNTPADPGISPWVPCEQGGSVGNTMVRLYATASDRDAGNLTTEFQIFKAGQTSPITQALPSNNGKFVTWAVPDASLPDGDYTWRARTTDQDGAQSGWSQTCKFTVDRTRPADAPKITSTMFPDGSKGWPQGTGKAREEGDFTLSSNGADGVTWYGYYTDWDPQVRSTTVAPGASFSAKLTPPGAGPHFVYAFSQDAAGNRSDTNVYQFYAARKDAEDGPHDVNGDGNRDVWSNDLFGSLLTYHGQGNSKFSASIASPESFTGAQVATLGRGDDDAYNDLLALQKQPGMTSKTLWLYSNQDGQGTVGSNRTERNVGQAKNNHWSDAEQIIAPGDLNYDGVPDILVKQGDKLWAYYNSYWGNLDDEKDPALVGGTDWNKYTVIAPGDVNGDKIPDLWLRDNATGDVYSTHGKKGLDESLVVDLASWGTLARTKVHSGLSLSSYPQVGSSGDLNGDGLVDLWARQADNTMVGWPGKASTDGTTIGSFGPQFQIDGVPGARIPSGTTLQSGQEYSSGNAKLVMKSDGNLVMLSKDGKQLWATGTGGNPGATARMQSDGSFIVLSADAKTTLWSTKTSTPGSYAMLQPRGVLVVYTASGQSLWSSGSQSRPDYDGDGYTDVAVRDANGHLWIYPGTGGSGTSTLGQRYLAGNGWWRDYWKDVHSADLNNDGYTDVVTRNKFGDLYLYPGTGRTGTETLGNPVLIGTGWDTYADLGFGDLNGDGRTDVIGRGSDGNLWVYPHKGGTGTDTLGNRVSIGVGWHAGYWPSLRFADMNGDNKVDIMAHSNNGTGKLHLYPNTSTGDSVSFGASSVVGEGWWNGEWTPFASDLNNDGKPEQVGVTRTGDFFDFLPEGRSLIGIGWNGNDFLL